MHTRLRRRWPSAQRSCSGGETMAVQVRGMGQEFSREGLDEPRPLNESSIEREFRLRGPVDDEWGRSESLDPDNVGDIADEGAGHRGYPPAFARSHLTHHDRQPRRQDCLVWNGHCWTLQLSHSGGDRHYNEPVKPMTEDRSLHAENELRARHLRLLTETIPHMLWSATPEGMVDYVNQRVVDYAQRKYEEFLGSGWTNTIHPDHVE